MPKKSDHLVIELAESILQEIVYQIGQVIIKSSPSVWDTVKNLITLSICQEITVSQGNKYTRVPNYLQQNYNYQSTLNKSKSLQEVGRQERRISHSEIYIEISKHLPYFLTKSIVVLLGNMIEYSKTAPTQNSNTDNLSTGLF